jgi:hypothetical protein
MEVIFLSDFNLKSVKRGRPGHKGKFDTDLKVNLMLLINCK